MNRSFSYAIVLTILIIGGSSCSIVPSGTQSVQAEVRRTQIRLPNDAIRDRILQDHNGKYFIYSTRENSEMRNIILSMGDSLVTVSDSVTLSPEGAAWLNSDDSFVFFERKSNAIVLSYYNIVDKNKTVLIVFEKDTYYNDLGISKNDKYVSYIVGAGKIEILDLNSMISTGRGGVIGLPVWSGETLSIDE